MSATPCDPVPAAPGRRRDLLATLRRIDGWGPGAWREALGAWRLRAGVIACEPRPDGDGVACWLLAESAGLIGRDPADDEATADWALGRCWRDLLTDCPVDADTMPRGPAVRAGNAAFIDRRPGRPATLCLRLDLRWPLAGMCCDGRRLARFLRRADALLATLAAPRPGVELRALRQAVRVQRALRTALAGRGLVAFLGDGARLARTADGVADPLCRRLRCPRALATTIDLGPLGRIRGLGLRTGVTALVGAPYHGKSTLLQAIAAGRDDHRPGDGRELVVCADSALTVHAEDGRSIKAMDLRPFFRRLPGGHAAAFSTGRASGATSMAASTLQGIAAGCRLLLIDEDAAAGNFVAVDPAMRRLLGAGLADTTCLVDVLPALSAHGIAVVLAVGANAQVLAAADRVIRLDRFQPSPATAAVRRLLPRRRSVPGGAWPLPIRQLADLPDCLLGPRHFLDVDADEPERPRVRADRGDVIVDLRRSGWPLDAALARGALCAAAWCCRLAGGERPTLDDLARRYAAWHAMTGARGLDPFDRQFVTLPPWQLVVSVLERLPGRPCLVSD